MYKGISYNVEFKSRPKKSKYNMEFAATHDFLLITRMYALNTTTREKLKMRIKRYMLIYKKRVSR